MESTASACRTVPLSSMTMSTLLQVLPLHELPVSRDESDALKLLSKIRRARELFRDFSAEIAQNRKRKLELARKCPQAST